MLGLIGLLILIIMLWGFAHADEFKHKKTIKVITGILAWFSLSSIVLSIISAIISFNGGNVMELSSLFTVLVFAGSVVGGLVAEVIILVILTKGISKEGLKNLAIIAWSLLIVAVLVLIVYFGRNLLLAKTEKTVHPVLTFNIENKGAVKFELYPEYAPNTVANIIKLVEKGYYNGKILYGKDDVVLYAGRGENGEVTEPKTSVIFDDVEENSDYDYVYSVDGEFTANGYNGNDLFHSKGVLTIIRNDYTQIVPSLIKESYNSGNSQLGIVMSDKGRNLNGAYTGFGKVVEGYDILEEIYNSAPTKEATDVESQASESIKAFDPAIKITSAEIDTFGTDYGMPKVNEAFDYQGYINQLVQSQYNVTQ